MGNDQEEEKVKIHRIIVIDDNPAIHEDFRKILIPFTESKNGTFSQLDKALFEEELSKKTVNLSDLPNYSIDFANQGQEGIEMMKKAFNENKPYSLAFVDVRMPPGLDGVETIEGIWKIDPWIQVVICTAYSDYSWEETIGRLGVSDNLFILKKPFDVSEVRQLSSALTEKWSLNIKLKKHVINLEEIVKDRTLALERSLALVRATLESTADGIFVEDLEGKVVDYNTIFSTMWQMPEAVLKLNLSKNVLEFESKQAVDPEAFLSKMQHLNKNFELEIIDELNLKDGRCFERYCKPHKMSGKIVGRVWSFRNISEQKKMHRELLFQATHDKLTNLPNRRLLYDRILQHMAFAKRNKTTVSILLFDLDKFKVINDSFGHTSGDSVLKLVSKRVSEILRASDTLARLGGDEFVAILEDKHEEPQTQLVAKKIIEVISKPFKLFDYEFSLSVSIGISVYPKDGGSPEELLQKADGAMYSVKSADKNSEKSGFKFYESGLSQHISQQLTLENDLRKAMRENQLKLYYQPLVDMTTGAIVGVEALIRWEHPSLGLLMPEAFLQIAEESGLIIPIGEWVLRTACAQSKSWQAEKLPFLKMAVNISGTQFKYPFFDEVVEKILKEAQLEAQYLEIELTEATIIENPIIMLDVLNKLKNIGVKLVINNFGSGYSSLGYLRQFSFDKLKIDGAFLRDINTNSNNSSLVHTIISMGNSLKLKVVAEGIETKDQVSILNEYKCDEAQGKLLSQPVTAEEFSNLLLNGHNLLKGSDL